MNDLKAIELINKIVTVIPNKEDISSILLLAGYHIIGKIEDINEPSVLIGLKYLYLRFCVFLKHSKSYIALNTSDSLISVSGRTGIVTKTLLFTYKTIQSIHI